MRFFFFYSEAMFGLVFFSFFGGQQPQSAQSPVEHKVEISSIRTYVRTFVSLSVHLRWAAFEELAGSHRASRSFRGPQKSFEGAGKASEALETKTDGPMDTWQFSPESYKTSSPFGQLHYVEFKKRASVHCTVKGKVLFDLSMPRLL